MEVVTLPHCKETTSLCQIVVQLVFVVFLMVIINTTEVVFAFHYVYL